MSGLPYGKTNEIKEELSLFNLSAFKGEEDLHLKTVFFKTTKENHEQAISKDDPSDQDVLVESALYDKDIAIITHPDSLDVLVNKNWKLPSDYIPNNLTTSTLPQLNTTKHQVREEAYEALTLLFKDALLLNHDLVVVSGYRDYQTQSSLYQYYSRKHGQEVADTFSARPGHSEHQLGLAIDISTKQLKGKLTIEFGFSEAGLWVQQNAYTYGFIIRYPIDKTSITGYVYEPWHLRYVGLLLAKELHDCQCTMEEFLANKDS